ncbi:amino acid adenylation domain-containing protein [Micromonospora sp. NPDC049301]|uniref:amino acid adenylation domain-containing protein n=1 Tax=Micromonospora sp. NPDC049301 TaxID=3155723 RepID=UPI00343CABDB
MRQTAASLRDFAERIALISPEVRAVGRRDSGWLTIGQLDQAASGLAWELVSRGVAPGDVVGLLLPRSVEFVVAAFAAWKVGAAYTPIDPAAPERDRSFILDNSNVRCVIASDGAVGRATGRQYCLVDDAMPARGTELRPFESIPLTPEDPAWVLYTSGSTGHPKGVIGSHGASLNRCTWMWEAQPFDGHDVSVQNTAPSVVDSIWEVWGSLAQGTPVVMPPAHASYDLDLLSEILAENQVTRICLVPSLLRAMLTTFPDLADRLPDLGIWTCSGETLDRNLANMFRTSLPGRTLLNQYGLTESCADVTTYDTRELMHYDGGDARVPIGRPIRGTEVFILDDQMRPVPTGDPGELWLAGPSLANGYANAPELTRDRFVVNGMGTADILFRTGDVVQIGPDGMLYHLGRRDRQVKIRGFRVEADGVEAVLKECEGVRDAAVRAWTTGDEGQLAAYVVPEALGEAPDVRELRDQMLKNLPPHAIPSSFTVLTELPRTASGKTDYKLLPAPGGFRVGSDVVEPRDEIEATIARIWRKILKTRHFGVLDDFYEIGGHSLALMRVIARVNSAYGVRLRRRDLTHARTVEAQARAVGRLADATPGSAGSIASVPAQRMTTQDDVGVDRASETQAAMWLHETCSAPGLYNIQLAFRIVGELNTDALRRALSDVVAAHRALRLGLEHEGDVLRLVENQSALSGSPLVVVETSEAIVRQQLSDEGAWPFDLAKGPLLRVLLLKVGITDHVMSLTVHHTVCDGQSLRTLLASLTAAYEARLAGAVPHAAASDGPVAAPTRASYRSLDRYPPALLPTDRPRPKRPDGHGASLKINVPTALLARVRGRARLLRTSPFLMCCAAFAVVLASWTGQRRFAISVPIADQHDEGAEDVVGCFMRTVPLNIDVPESTRVPELLQSLRGALEEAYEAPSVTRVEVDGQPPQLMLAYDEAHYQALSLPLTAITPMAVDSKSSKLDLTLYLDEADEHYDCRIEYSTALFEEGTMHEFGQDFLKTLTWVCGEENSFVGKASD